MCLGEGAFSRVYLGFWGSCYQGVRIYYYYYWCVFVSTMLRCVSEQSRAERHVFSGNGQMGGLEAVDC